VGAYYYLGAQLPYLIYGQNAPMSSVAFRELAQQEMSSSEAAVLDYCTLDVEHTRTPSKFVNKWKEWELALRLNLAKNRALKLKRESGAPVAPSDPTEAVNAAREALAFESPLEAEIFLDKARWDAIESFQGYNIFNENAIYAYMLKLLLMERRASFNTEEGFTEYKGLYAAILGESK